MALGVSYEQRIFCPIPQKSSVFFSFENQPPLLHLTVYNYPEQPIGNCAVCNIWEILRQIPVQAALM